MKHRNTGDIFWKEVHVHVSRLKLATQSLRESSKYAIGYKDTTMYQDWAV